MKKEPSKIISISVSLREAEVWTESARKENKSRSRWMRDGIERTRDMEQILANQNVLGRTPRERARNAGEALLDLYDHNHAKDLDES